jgi:hypothetical protein
MKSGFKKWEMHTEKRKYSNISHGK